MSVNVLTRDEVIARMEEIARDLGCSSLEEALQKQDAGELPKSGAEAALAGYRFLFDLPDGDK